MERPRVDDLTRTVHILWLEPRRWIGNADVAVDAEFIETPRASLLGQQLEPASTSRDHRQCHFAVRPEDNIYPPSLWRPEPKPGTAVLQDLSSKRHIVLPFQVSDLRSHPVCSISN